VTSNDIVCNGGPNPTTKTSTVINVQAGSTAKLTWRHTLTSAGNDVIDASHKGPVMAYLKKVSDAKTDSGVGCTSSAPPQTSYQHLTPCSWLVQDVRMARAQYKGLVPKSALPLHHKPLPK
jgi:hypothetical protein